MESVDHVGSDVPPIPPLLSRQKTCLSESKNGVFEPVRRRQSGSGAGASNTPSQHHLMHRDLVALEARTSRPEPFRAQAREHATVEVDLSLPAPLDLSASSSLSLDLRPSCNSSSSPQPSSLSAPFHAPLRLPSIQSSTLSNQQQQSTSTSSLGNLPAVAPLSSTTATPPKVSFATTASVNYGNNRSGTLPLSLTLTAATAAAVASSTYSSSVASPPPRPLVSMNSGASVSLAPLSTRSMMSSFSPAAAGSAMSLISTSSSSPSPFSSLLAQGRPTEDESKTASYPPFASDGCGGSGPFASDGGSGLFSSDGGSGPFATDMNFPAAAMGASRPALRPQHSLAAIFHGGSPMSVGTAGSVNRGLVREKTSLGKLPMLKFQASIVSDVSMTSASASSNNSPDSTSAATPRTPKRASASTGGGSNTADSPAAAGAGAGADVDHHLPSPTLLPGPSFPGPPELSRDISNVSMKSDSGGLSLWPPDVTSKPLMSLREMSDVGVGVGVGCRSDSSSSLSADFPSSLGPFSSRSPPKMEDDASPPPPVPLNEFSKRKKSVSFRTNLHEIDSPVHGISKNTGKTSGDLKDRGIERSRFRKSVGDDRDDDTEHEHEHESDYRGGLTASDSRMGSSTGSNFKLRPPLFARADSGDHEADADSLSPMRPPEGDPTASLPMPPQTERDISAPHGGLVPIALGASISVASSSGPIGRLRSADLTDFLPGFRESSGSSAVDDRGLLATSRREDSSLRGFLQDREDSLSVSGSVGGYDGQLPMTTFPTMSRQTTVMSTSSIPPMSPPMPPSALPMPPSSLPLTRNDSEETVGTDFSSSANHADISDVDGLRPIERQVSAESSAGYHYDDVAPVKGDASKGLRDMQFPFVNGKLSHSAKGGRYEIGSKRSSVPGPSDTTLNLTQLHEQSSGENYPSSGAPSRGWGGRGKRYDMVACMKANSGRGKGKLFGSSLVPPRPTLQPLSVSETSAASPYPSSGDEDEDSDARSRSRSPSVSAGSSPLFRVRSSSPPPMRSGEDGVDDIEPLSAILESRMKLSMTPDSHSGEGQRNKATEKSRGGAIIVDGEAIPASDLVSPSWKNPHEHHGGYVFRSTTPTDDDRQEAVRQARKAEAAALALMDGGRLGGSGDPSPSRSTKPAARFSCTHPGCGRSFTSKRDMERHDRTHSGLKPFECTKCNRRFKLKSHLTRHIKAHNGEVAKPHACKLCDKSFAYPSLLRSHMNIHTGSKPHRCPLCSRSFTQKSNLRKHQQTHLNANHECSLCSVKFTKKRLLVAHLEEDHRLSPPQLRKHLKRQKMLAKAAAAAAKSDSAAAPASPSASASDTASDFPLDGGGGDEVSKSGVGVGVRAFLKSHSHVCDVCDKRFAKPSMLQKHMRVHTRERPFGCLRCGRTFSQKSNLSTHERRCMEEYTEEHGGSPRTVGVVG